MRVPEHYTADAGMFFDGHPAELALYEALFRRMDGAFPEGTVKVQKSQISLPGQNRSLLIKVRIFCAQQNSFSRSSRLICSVISATKRFKNWSRPSNSKSVRRKQLPASPSSKRNLPVPNEALL